MDLIQKEAHEKLNKELYDCKCKPYLKGEGYCGKCENAVIKFMDKHGAGVLTRDIELEELEKQYGRICKENSNLLRKLQDKIKRVEELKTLLKSKENSSQKPSNSQDKKNTSKRKVFSDGE